MIVSRIIGGLGNQMFQYAAGRALALRRGVPFSIDTRGFSSYKTHSFGLNCFSAELKEAPGWLLPNPSTEGRLQRLRRRLTSKRLNVYTEKTFTFDPSVLDLRDGVYLDGYWQTEKYFKDFAEIIREDFTVGRAPNAVNQAWLRRIVETHSVSLHIRRGDYVSNAAAFKVHGTCDLGYYRRAAAYVRERTGVEPDLFVFSDDPDWVEANLDLPYRTHLVRDNDAFANYEDLRLMTACRHHIVANSSFSWWGAWLDGRPESITIAPTRWFAGETPNPCDLVPQRWVLL